MLHRLPAARPAPLALAMPLMRRDQPPGTSTSSRATDSNSSTSLRNRSPTRDTRRCTSIEAKDYNGEALALLTGSDFTDGTIEVDLAGLPGAGSDAGARGFVGIAFRSTPARHGVRVLLPAADQRPRRRSAPAQSLDAIHLGAGFSAGSACVRRRRACTSPTSTSMTGAWTHVKIEVSGAQGAPVRQRRRAAGAHRQRSQTRRHRAARSACGSAPAPKPTSAICTRSAR